MHDGGLTLALLGDVLVGGRALDALRRMGVAAMARRIWAPLDGADVVVANLEAPITGSAQARENKRYNLKTSPEIVGLFDGRFVLGLANNHMMDYGERGLLDTLEVLDGGGIAHAGAGRNLDEARQPALVDAGGWRLAVLSAADARWQPATAASAGIFPARPALLRESIRDAQNRADEVVVFIHAGTEYVPVPSPAQLQLADLCLEEGARVVSFHHSHCLSGFQQSEKGVVLFGTGTYVFPSHLGAPFAGLRKGAAWKVEIPASRQEVLRIHVEPFLLNPDGLPERATGREAQEILKSLECCSRQLRAGHLTRWRLNEMAKPKYIQLSLLHYADIARRQGARHMLQTLWRGTRAQLR
jgi:poly-gamma-glutamate synthesis protein (capsule biosynthesis protein)